MPDLFIHHRQHKEHRSFAYLNVMNLKINFIQHIGIPVTNIQISEKFYTRLGFTNVMTSIFYIDEKPGTCAMMQLNSMTIELYQLPDHKMNDIENRKDGHIDHIAFDVDDINTTYQLLAKNGLTPIEPTPVFLNFWNKGCKYFNILGPDGERIEFNEIVK